MRHASIGLRYLISALRLFVSVTGIMMLSLGVLIMISCQDDNDDDDDDEPPSDSLERYFEVDCLRVDSCDVYIRARVLSRWKYLTPLDFTVYLVKDLNDFLSDENASSWEVNDSWKVKLEDQRGGRMVLVLGDSFLDSIEDFANDSGTYPDRSGLVFHLSGNNRYFVFERKLLGNFLSVLSQEQSSSVYDLIEWERERGDLDKEFSRLIEDICASLDEEVEKANYSARSSGPSSCYGVSPDPDDS